MIHSEFVRWFAEEIAGPREVFQAVAEEIWRTWCTWKLSAPHRSLRTRL
jgi:hypothetical protein